MSDSKAKFDAMVMNLAHNILHAEEVDVGEWHAQNVSGRKDLISRELLNTVFTYSVPRSQRELQEEVKANQPWAEEHFLERVSRQPLNPPPSHERWPYARKGNKDHLEEGKFSHTYPERYWPKEAGDDNGFNTPNGRDPQQNWGLRYPYGDLDDLVLLLIKNSQTRQAYLPVWFPEDLSAALQHQRVPCSLGYHFIIRGGKLHCNYYIRSCDFVRHFRDDVYHTARLMQWVSHQVYARGKSKDPLSVSPGTLNMYITSLHAFNGDIYAGTLNGKN